MDIEEGALRRRFAELAMRADRRGGMTCTPFLTLAEQSILLSMERQLALAPIWQGGYDGAERQLACFCREPEQEIHAPIVCLRVQPKGEKFVSPLGHRDMLGAIMGLGIKRECIGDIVPRDKGGYVFCLADMADYLCRELTEVGRAAVTCVPCAVPELLQTPPESSTFVAASLRLDALIAAIWHLSRSESQQLFPKQLVFVNGKCVLTPGDNAREGDVISVRGKGRFRLEQVSGETRKGRLRIQAAVYG